MNDKEIFLINETEIKDCTVNDYRKTMHQENKKKGGWKVSNGRMSERPLSSLNSVLK